MENATKALVMAGSVLIAVIIIATLYSFITTLSANAEQEDLALLVEQTENFNKEYEAFERKLMRGTDLITVINKAIANNDRYVDQDHIYDIDVVFTLVSPVTEVRVNVDNGKIKEKKETEIFSEAKKYSVLDEKISDDISKFLQIGIYTSNKAESYTMVPLEGTEKMDEYNHTKIYDSFTVFKRKFFTCTKLEYSAQTGRVNLLEFKEVAISGDALEGYN